jgi:hypothetical protein
MVESTRKAITDIDHNVMKAKLDEEHDDGCAEGDTEEQCWDPWLTMGAVIYAARARMLQPPDGGQAVILSLQPDSATVPPFLAVAANARLCPLNVARQKQCKQA